MNTLSSPYGVTTTIENGLVSETRAYVLSEDGVRRYAADIESAYHAARPWTRASIMKGIKEDASTDRAARQLFVELARMWGPEGMGGEATYENGWEEIEVRQC